MEFSVLAVLRFALAGVVMAANGPDLRSTLADRCRTAALAIEDVFREADFLGAFQTLLALGKSGQQSWEIRDVKWRAT